MNSKLFLYNLLFSVLTIVNSLPTNNEDELKLNLNNPNLKYSKKYGSTSSKVGKGIGKTFRWLLIIAIIIITVCIVACICCCLGCCACFGGNNSEKKDNYENNTIKPNVSSPNINNKPETSINNSAPSQPLPTFNPANPPYGSYPPAQGFYPPAQGSYPPAQASPYGQSMYPQV